MSHLLGVVALGLAAIAICTILTIATACACYWIDGGNGTKD